MSNGNGNAFGPAPGRLALATQRAIDRFKTGKPGDVVTLDEMQQLTGRNCAADGNGRQNVDSAIRHCEANFSAVWRWDRERQVWVCLGPAARTTECAHRLHLIRKRAVRTGRIAVTTDATQLSPADRAQLSVTVAVAGLMVAASSGKFRELATEVAVQSTAKLEAPPTANLVSLMTKSEKVGA